MTSWEHKLYKALMVGDLLKAEKVWTFTDKEEKK